jgi:hypothetical protein
MTREQLISDEENRADLANEAARKVDELITPLLELFGATECSAILTAARTTLCEALAETSRRVRAGVEQIKEMPDAAFH